MSDVGYTGTRRGMTPAQREALRAMLEALLLTSWCRPDDTPTLHFGDCVGGDAEAFRVARTVGYRTVCHPPTDPRLRAWCEADVVLDPQPYLVRNRDIVDSTSCLIATPGESREVLRSGTWTTWRYAMRRHARDERVWLIRPDGTIT